MKDAPDILGNGSQTEETNGKIVLRVHFREGTYNFARCFVWM